MTFKQTFFYLCSLSCFLFVLQLLNTASFLRVSLAQGGLTLPWISYQHLLFCLFSHLVLVLGYSFLLSIASYPSSRLFKHIDPFVRLIIIWCMATLTLFIANQLYYPQSQYAFLSSALLNNQTARFILYIGLFILISQCLMGVITLVNKKLILLLFLLLFLLFFFLNYPIHKERANHYASPDIILLGVDSLRLDQLHHAPYLTQWIDASLLFTDAKTPLARTFPAWVSILTGLYPVHHGARFNLTESSAIQTRQSMAWTLKEKGYQTLYASDEKRFSQIDKQFGFDTLVGPSTGVNDFIQSKLNDMPLSNIVMNTWLGKLLFPYNYSNRAAYVHYAPDTFNKELNNTLTQLPKNKPLFLSIHLTLTHWPLIWKDTSQIALKHENSLYGKALNTLDGQLHHIIQLLKQNGRLSHTILVIFSDHGDAVLEPHSRLTDNRHYQPYGTPRFQPLINLQKGDLNKSFGHGTDLLTPKQIQTLLAFRVYGNKPFKRTTIDTPVSLVDIKPTLYELIQLPIAQTDGLSLIPLFEGHSLADRMIYSETGFDPKQKLGATLNTDTPKIKTIMSLAKTYYRVKKDNEYLILKKDKITPLIYQKQVAVYYQDWILALYPEETGYCPIILNTKTLAWSDSLNSPFSKSTPAHFMLKQLMQHYPFLTQEKMAYSLTH